METSVSGIFACGNVVHVHDLVDFVTEESKRAGFNAAVKVLAEEEYRMVCSKDIAKDFAEKGSKTDCSRDCESAERQTGISTHNSKLSGCEKMMISAAIRRSAEKQNTGKGVKIINGNGISYTVPQKIEDTDKSVNISCV